MTCPSCGQSLESGWKACPKCGRPYSEVSSVETVAEPVSAPPSPRPSPPPSSASGLPSRPGKERFAPGAIFAGRYQIISLLGKGGMGEVYRAEDLQLEQTVALKFLPPDLAIDSRFSEKFRNEVRIARSVSHPNVCRVYDIGEADGLLYLTMEFVQGEDLGSLLSRIGRLPQEKALEMARKLCAGLAAAHDKGVLHRDLKPGNILIDGKGNLLITDFGLAALVGEAHDVRSGTPQYMAPEQLAGTEVTQRSDIYSLGLVLYEMFTGKRAYIANSIAELQSMQAQATPTSISSLVGDVDPAVESAIARCLSPLPKDRPASALAVSAALPGGDPLAAALAAGETPSPELVAASGRHTGISVRIATAMLAFTIAGLLASLWMASSVNLYAFTPAPFSPHILASKARELADKLGYAQFADSAVTTNWNDRLLNYFREPSRKAELRGVLAKGDPSAFLTMYRQSPRRLETIRMASPVQPGDPPVNVSGMVNMNIDGRGRLLNFLWIPPQVDDTPAGRPSNDWTPFFTAAGIDPKSLSDAQPRWIPPAAFDHKQAWTGKYPNSNLDIRVEASSWRGKPVQFVVLFPWDRPTRLEVVKPTPQEKASQWVNNIINVALLFGSPVFAWRNWKAGRADLKGASRLAFTVWALSMATFLCMVASFLQSVQFIGHLITAIGYAFVNGALAFVLYLALEPFVRRRWPQLLVAWNRALLGQFQDAFVASNLLAGVALGAFWTVIFQLSRWVEVQAGEQPARPWIVDGFADALGSVLNRSTQAILLGLALLLLMVVLRMIFRNTWLAGAAVVVAMSAVAWFAGSSPQTEVPFTVLQFGLGILMLIRFGALPMILAIFISDVLTSAMTSINPSDWHAGYGITLAVIVAALGFLFFRWTLAGRKLVTGDWME